MKVIRLPEPFAVLSVSLLPAADLTRPNPEIVPPKPRPVTRKPEPAPTPQAVPLATPENAPAASTAVAPAPTPAPTSPVAAAAEPTQARFDAAYLDNPKPSYPALSRRSGEQGKVMLRVQVSASGLPTDVQLHAGSGFSRLDNAALDAVRRWKFVPARLGSEPVAASVLVPIVFSLKD
jgi:protein TonB